MKKIEIKTDEDTFDCEVCGYDYAEGGSVYVDGELVLEREAIAACYGGSDFRSYELLVMALDKLGIEVLVDGDRFHITHHDDEYHGEP